MMNTLLIGLVLLVAGRLLDAFMFPAARWCIRRWVQLYTLGAIGDQREERRSFALDYFHGFERERRDEGVKPEHIGWRLFFYLLRCMPSDTIWAASTATQRLAAWALTGVFTVSLRIAWSLFEIGQWVRPRLLGAVFARASWVFVLIGQFLMRVDGWDVGQPTEPELSEEAVRGLAVLVVVCLLGCALIRSITVDRKQSSHSAVV